jgi:hypothetical protein
LKKHSKISTFNDKIAKVINDATGNMYFFWASLLFVLALRLSHPPNINELLLDVENDLQLLLLAVNAVMSAKQMAALTRIIKHVEKEEERIEKELGEKATK